MKVTVLENVSHLDDNLSAYLKQYHSKDDVTVVYSIMSRQPEKQQEIHDALSECEMLCFCSTLSNREQLEFFVLHLLPKYKSLKQVRVLYLHSKHHSPENKALLQKLNQEVSKEVFAGLLELMETVEVSEVFSVALTKNEKTYLVQLEWYFDVVPLYYNEKHKMLWHVRAPYIVLPGDHLYLDRKYLYYEDRDSVKNSKTLDKGLALFVEQKDLSQFQELMRELRAMVEHQKESCELQDFGDSAVLIREKEAWLALMDKYKL